MSIALSVLYGDSSYYREFPEGKTLVVSEQPEADLVIPNLGCSFSARSDGKAVSLSVKEEKTAHTIDAPLNESTVIDFEKKLAVFFTVADHAKAFLELPSSGEIHVGKRDKPSQDGQRNEVVLNFPFVSRNHFSIVRQNGETYVYDANSTNGLFLNGNQINTAQLKDGDVLSIFTIRMILKGNRLLFENVGNKLKLYKIKEPEQRKAAPLSRISERDLLFSRAPRLTTGVETEVINVEKPPQAGGTPQINWLTVLITPLVSVVLMLILVFVLGMSPVMLIMSGVMSVVAAVIAIINYKQQKRKHGQTDELINEKYRAYLADISSRLEESHKRQFAAISDANPAPAECLRIIKERNRRLWERQPSDGDFLTVRIGTGELPAKVTAKFQQAQVVIEENKLETEAKSLADDSLFLSNAPVLCDLSGAKQTGIVGNREDEIRLLRNMIVELATAHSYDELKIVVFIPENETAEWDWIRWLPHCADDGRTKRYIFSSLNDAEETLDEIEEELNRRKNESGDFHGAELSSMIPHYLFVAAAPWVEKHPIRKLLQSDNELGCSAVFVYHKLTSLPKECDQIIEVGCGNGEIYSKLSSAKKVKFKLDEFSLADADCFARTMAPIYTDTEKSAASLPGSISFLDGYGVSRPEQLKIAERWRKAETFKNLSVPIAALPGGDTFDFDIHEKRHGVNGIVAGMPGSGKTEMVQSWLLSLAVNYSPQDVSFVLVDFKGTGMIAPFRDLPHLAGSISNLDTNIDRNLTAIRSEVHRREAIIDKYSADNVKNINDLNRNYKKGLVPENLPILLIVIDEFAEFKKNFPDFGAEIDSLTSKGRALGIFVVLMTQKPAGVVSSKSEDNIKFRWCLRVANFNASREMLGRPDAAKINTPGRAYVKVGEDDVYEQVQSFWSGAPYDPDRNRDRKKEILISRVELNGKRIACEYTQKKKTAETHKAEIDAVVQYIAEYCRAQGIPAAEKVWTERLPERISLNRLLPECECFNGRNWPDAEKTAPVIGLLDDPNNQQQYPVRLDLAKHGHTVIYGAPVTGKTTLLHTMIMSTAMTRKPDEVSIYIMDFGGWNFGIFKDLPHVGGIANDNEPERLRKLMLLISDILQDRRIRFSKAGVGNISAYRDISNKIIPDVFLLVDNFGAMIKMYPDMDSFFMTLTSTGANYGVYLIASASATNAVPMRISQNIKNSVALQMIDKSDYTFTVGKVNSVLPPILGRGYVKGSPPLEFQTALPAAGADDKDVSDNIRMTASEMQRAWKGDLPAMIPEMPEVIPYGSIKTSGIALGLSVDKVQPIVYDYSKQHYLLVSGTEHSGKSSMLQVIVKQMKEIMGGKLFVFNLGGNGLDEIRNISDTYLTTAAEIDSFIENLRPELLRRQAEKKENANAIFKPLLFAIDDYTTFFKAVSNDTIVRLLAVVKIGEGLGLYMIAAGNAYELSGFFNKGEALTLTLGKAKQVVMLGGCMNDHGAIPLKASYSQKNVPVREHEGIFINNAEYVVFRTINIKGEKT